MSLRKRAVVIAAIIGACLAVSATAVAGGGSSIAAATEFTVGTSTTGGGSCSGTTCNSRGAYTDYWKFEAQASDFVTVDFTGLAPSTDLTLCLFRPDVTDATEAASACLIQDEGVGANDWQFTIPTAGNWILAILGTANTSTVNYQLAIHAVHYTQVALTAPKHVKAKGKVTYAGKVSGASGGTLQLAVRSPGSATWKPIAPTSIGGDGSFAAKSKVGKAGKYSVKAVYKGDASHEASSATVSFKVT